MAHAFWSTIHFISSLNLLSLIVGAIIGTLVSIYLSELTRIFRMKRLLLGPAMLPSFELLCGDQHIELRMFGDYGIMNMSDLPINIQRPHLMGYNLASRAFQFKIVPQSTEADFKKRLESLFEKIQVPPKSELILIAEKACAVQIERVDVRAFPTFLWRETLELVRIGSRSKFGHRAYLYSASYYSKKERRVWYRPTGRETSSGCARCLALPGKLLYRRRIKKVQSQSSRLGPGADQPPVVL
jgi:hypothetical protein